MFFDKLLEKILAWDSALLVFLNQLNHPLMDDIMWWVSGKFTWLPFYVMLVALVAFVFRWRALPLILLIALLITISDFLASGIFKPFFERLRPSHNPDLEGMLHLVNGYKGGMYGFVSSHACNVFSLAFYFFFTTDQKIPWLKYIMFPWAVLVSYSRVYLGVHYPLDILVPVFLSVPVAFVVSRVYFIIESRLFTKSEYYNYDTIKK